jgi:chromate transporter
MVLALTAFGGPQAHITMLLDIMVKKRAYLTEEELLELYALCQILPGPTSTQTITAIGFKRGGPKLAFLTLLVWALPAVTIMTALGITLNTLQDRDISLEFTRFIRPMAIGFVGYAAYAISVKVVHTKTAMVIMVISAILSYFVSSPYLYPVILLAGGAFTAFKYKQQPQEEKEGPLQVNWSNFILWFGVFALAAILGAVTQYLPIRLFENFYRNGSLIFGGGQVLIPFLFTEFVEFKGYLTSEEFLSGFAFVQAMPGPVFSFSAYVGAMSMQGYGFFQQILGGFASAIGVFLPGTFLIFFLIRFWDQLKKYRIVRASLEGIHAVSSGMVVAAALILLKPIDLNAINIGIIIVTIIMLFTRKVPSPVLILVALLLGFVL